MIEKTRLLKKLQLLNGIKEEMHLEDSKGHKYDERRRKLFFLFLSFFLIKYFEFFLY